MPSITVETEFVFKQRNITAYGTATYSGPYHEFDGISRLSLTADGRRLEATEMTPELIAAAEEAVEEEAYCIALSPEDTIDAADGSYYDDSDYYESHTSGPDYWRDPESGEYRCG